LVEEVASEDETLRLRSEAELQRRLSEKIARLNRTMLYMTGIVFLMDIALLAVAYVWLRPRIDAAETWKKAAESVDLKDIRRRATGVLGEAGEWVGTARETAAHGLDAAGSGLEAAGHGLVSAGQGLLSAEKLAEKGLKTARGRVTALR
jgi:hypothetical protein